MTNFDTFRRSLIVGERSNVRSDPESGPVMRTITKIELIERKGETWLYWYWRKEGQMDGKPDCGYSGHMLSGEGAHEH